MNELRISELKMVQGLTSKQKTNEEYFMNGIIKIDIQQVIFLLDIGVFRVLCLWVKIITRTFAQIA